jgi:hypothetical protein
VFLKFNGSPGGVFNVLAPSTIGSFFIVYNFSDQNLTFKHSGGTGVTINSGAKAIVVHDGGDYVSV